MVQPAQDRRRDHLTVFGEAMTRGQELVAFGQWIGDAGSQTGVWATAVIVGRPFAKDPPEMFLVDQDQPIQTLPTHRADQSLAERVGLRGPRWGLEHVPPHRRDRPVDRCRINAVPIVEDEPVGRLGGDDRAKLLDRPRRRGMLRHVPVEDPTRTDLEDDEDIEDAEADGHRREEVTGEDRVRMIPHKRRLSVSNSLSGGNPELHEVPAVRSPTDVVQISGSRPAFFGERQWRVAIQRGVAAGCVVVNLEIGELLFKITAIPEQYMVEKFSAQRPNQALHERV
jgi:hypothetical protein